MLEDPMYSRDRKGETNVQPSFALLEFHRPAGRGGGDGMGLFWGAFGMASATEQTESPAKST